MTKQEIAIEALDRAENNASETNYETIFNGFMAMGIDKDDIEPRVNVFTFNAWKAKGRFVKKGEKGVRVITYIQVDKKEEDSDEVKKVFKKRQTTVFHISQTSPTDDKTEVIESASTEENVKSEQEHPAAAKTEEKVLNWYEEKQARRKERYLELAGNAAIQSGVSYSRAVKMADAIPFGQPILLGHHSERRDRNYRSKITKNFEKSFEQSSKAEYYENKAASVGKAGISSDDPDAILKLQKKLTRLEKSHEIMKSVNKIVKNKKMTHDEKYNEIIKLGIKEKDINELLTGNIVGTIGFAPYALQNNNAEINRVKKRIKSLSKIKNNDNVIEENNKFIFKINYEINRIMFIFDGKPEKEVRKILGENSFNWSSYNNAWIRKISHNALYAANSIKKQLLSM
ncbi:DUF3560 domain-containing protein [Providencia sp. 2024EL-00732]|uniref:DUF3560 domain-containing protein n=1 Tax=Providencia sp. 2024EL-00732 TaxID=3374242 RepID=UPI003757FC7D